MKLKKLSLLGLAAVFLLSLSAPICLAAEVGDLTPIPDEPSYVGHKYVQMTAHTSIQTDNNWRLPTSYSRGIDNSKGGLYVGFTNTGGPHFLNTADPATRSSKGTYYSRSYGPRINLESTNSADPDNTPATVNSGYLVIHNTAVLLTSTNSDAADKTGDVVSAFGITALFNKDVSEGSTATTAQALVSTANGKKGAMVMTLYVEGVGQRDVPVDNWVNANEGFDYKMIINLDQNTYDVYLNDNPVAMDIPARDDDVEALHFTVLGLNQGDTEYGTTSCFSVDKAWVQQYRQAALQRSLNKTVANADDQLTLFYTYGLTDIGNQFYGTIDGTRIVSCDDIPKLIIESTGVGVASFLRVYCRAEDMTKYNYDNLNLLIAKTPTLDIVNGSISGDFFALGGKASNPVVISALFDQNEKILRHIDVTPVTGYGMYNAAFDFTNAPSGSVPTFMILNGMEKLQPLAAAQVLPAR